MLQRQVRHLQRQLEARDALHARAADVVSQLNADAMRLQRSNDFWRNLLTSAAFARGLGDERPMTEIVEASHPALLRGAP